MGTVTYSPSQRDEIVSDWVQAVDLLLDQVTEWVQHEPGWTVERRDMETTEEGLGTYRVGALTIATPDGRAHVEPVARIVFFALGSVEVYAWPTLYRVRLLRGKEVGEWSVLTDSGIVLRQRWDRENFVALVRDLLSAQ